MLWLLELTSTRYSWYKCPLKQERRRWKAVSISVNSSPFSVPASPPWSIFYFDLRPFSMLQFGLSASVRPVLVRTLRSSGRTMVWPYCWIDSWSPTRKPWTCDELVGGWDPTLRDSRHRAFVLGQFCGGTRRACPWPSLSVSCPFEPEVLKFLA